MRLKFIFCILIIWAFGAKSDAQLLQWNTFGNVGTETTEPSIFNNANVGASNITIGAGVTPAANANRLGGSNWFDTGDTNPTILAESITGNDYLQFVVAPNPGFAFTPTSLVFGWDRSTTGPATLALRSSADGYATNLGTSAVAASLSIATAYTITISGLSNITSATTFRLYGYGATATGGTGGFDVATNVANVQLNGTTAAVVTAITSAQNGDWYTGTTWIGGVVPTNAQDVVIAHNITATTAITRNPGTATVINVGAKLAITASVTGDYYNNNGSLAVNGTFELQNGSYAVGNPFSYGVAGTLSFNTSFNYAINNSDVFWPVSNGPFNVTVLNGGIVLNASRTVNGLFSIGNVSPNGGVDFPSNTLTLNGTIRIDSGGYFIKAPVYGASSTLVYNTGGNYGRNIEWNAAGAGTIGSTPGYPNNVSLTGNTTLDYFNGTAGPKAINGNLTIGAGSFFDMSLWSLLPASACTVGGNIDIYGRLKLGNSLGDDIKTVGNFSVYAPSGIFTGNNRAVFFSKPSGVQTINAPGGITIPYVVFDSTTGNRTVQMNNDLSITAPLTGPAIIFGSASDILQINGQTLTIGTTNVANNISGTGTFSGGATSNMNLFGTGPIGLLGFTTGFQNLGTLTVDRSSGATAFTLATPLTINTAMTLTNGRADVGNNPLTIAAAATLTSSPVNYIIADLLNGANAALRKVFTGAGSNIFPIGDSAASANGSEYSPVTVNLTGGAYTGAYVGVVVNDIKQPNLDASTDYITRYWDVSSSGITGPTSFTASATYADSDVNTPAFEANYLSNKWDGSNWSNGGSLVNAASNVLTVPVIAGAINSITAGVRDADINVKVSATDYLSGSTYNFGSQLVGSNTAVTFTIQNIGQQPLTVSAATFAGGGAYVYTTPYTVGTIAGPSGTKTFTVTFSPSGTGTFTGSISIPNSDTIGSEAPYIINFTGMGVTPAPDINITGLGVTLTTINTPNSLNNTLFAAIPVATTSAPKTYTIQNLGNTNLVLTPPSPYVVLGGANPGDFTVSAPPTGTIIPSGSTTFDMTFTPTAGGNRTATVTVFSNDPDEPFYTFNVSGTGQDREIEVTGSGVAIVDGTTTVSIANNTQFGNVNVTSGSVSKIFTIYNPGALVLSISNTTITGPDAADFSITAFPSASLASNTSTVLVITFDPSTVGVKNATVTITNDDSNENPYRFAIQGNAVDYIPCALGAFQTIAVQDFEAVPATPTMSYTVTQQTGAGAYSVGGGTAYGSSRTPGMVSNKFAGAQSFQAAGYSTTSATEKTTTVDFATVDASAYQEVSLSLKVGAYSTNTTQGPDGNPEKVNIFISTNNGATWSQEIDIAGNSNSIWDINSSSGTVSWNYDGNNISSVYASAMTSTNTGPRSITLNNIPSSSQLKVRVTLTLDRLDELWVIDDVKLQGKTFAVSTWNGTSWSPAVPTNSTKAIINGNFNTTPNGNIEACECQINSAFTLNVAPGNYLEVQSNITNNGILTVANTGSLVQVNNNAANTGTISVVRNTAPYEKYDYTYWSSPVASANIGTTFPGWRTDYSFTFNTANFADLDNDTFDDAAPYAWTFVGPAANMIPGKGYAIMGNTSQPATNYPLTNAITFSGAANNGVFPIAVALSGNAANVNDDYNLIGNPYPSSISATSFINANPNISGTLYFWTHVGDISASNPGPNAQDFISDDYALFNLTGGTRASFTGSPTPNGLIGSGEGFLVEAATAGNVTFDNAMRNKTYSNTQFFRSSELGDDQDRIWLNLRNSDGMFSQQLIGFFDDATNGYDRGYDGAVNNVNNFVNFYSFIDGEKYKIQGRSQFNINDFLPLGYSSGVAGTFSISIDRAEGQLASVENIYLEDKLLNITQNLNQAPYVFVTDSGTFDNRFVLKFTDLTLKSSQFELNYTNAVIAVTDKQINIKSFVVPIKKLAIFDVLGRQIYLNDNVNDLNVSCDLSIQHQPLIVKITFDTGFVLVKKIIF